MKTEIGLFEAKNKLSELADKVARTGETVIITRRGKPLVRMMPVENPSPSADEIRAALKRLREFGKKHPLILYPGETIKDLIEDGRR